MKNNAIIISIHPCYVEKIWSGEKIFEYRRQIPPHIKYMLIYSTAPVKMITAFAEVDAVLTDSVESIWQRTKGNSGISRQNYFQYFSGCEKANAIKLKNVHKLETFLPLNSLEGIQNAPQSYVYLKEPLPQLLKKIAE